MKMLTGRHTSHSPSRLLQGHQSPNRVIKLRMLGNMVSFIDRLIDGLIWVQKKKRREPDTIFAAMNAVPWLLSLVQERAAGLAIVRAAGRCGLARTLTFWSGWNILRPSALITRRGSHVKGDILPGVRSAVSGHSLTLRKELNLKTKESQDGYSRGFIPHYARHDRRSILPSGL